MPWGECLHWFFFTSTRKSFFKLKTPKYTARDRCFHHHNHLTDISKKILTFTLIDWNMLRPLLVFVSPERLSLAWYHQNLLSPALEIDYQDRSIITCFISLFSFFTLISAKLISIYEHGTTNINCADRRRMMYGVIFAENEHF